MPPGLLFGQIQLQCGPKGPSDGDGLTFPSGRLNVFIGPNNAGKSLALRELGGKGSTDGYWRHETQRLPGRLIRSVGYSPAVEDEVGEAVKTSVLRAGDEVHEALRGLRWRELLRTLEEREAASLGAVQSLREQAQAALPLDQLPSGFRDQVTQGLESGVWDGLIPLVLALISGPQGAPRYRDAAQVLLNPVIQAGCAVLEPLGFDLSDVRGLRAEEAVPRLEADLPVALAAALGNSTKSPSLDWKRLINLAPWALQHNKWRDLRRKSWRPSTRSAPGASTTRQTS
jgi:hypothetical protein